MVANKFDYFEHWVENGIIGLFDVFTSNHILRIICAVIIFDLWMYFWHRLNHEIHFLWRFHRTHHTDPQMDVTTASRFHPIEITISHFLNILILGALGLNTIFLGTYKIFMVPVIMFHHSNVALPAPIDKIFSYLLVMPSMHRVHHSEIMKETNSNYGSIFSIWDRLFGTFRIKKNIKSITYGIGQFKTKKWQNIFGLLQLPFKT